MQLHAEAVLDLVERRGSEIQFRAVAGDFRLLQGKFLLSQPEPEVMAQLSHAACTMRCSKGLS